MTFIFLPKIIKIGGNLTQFWQKQICLVFFGTRCRWKVTVVNAPCLNPSQIGWYSIYLPQRDDGMEG